MWKPMLLQNQKYFSLTLRAQLDKPKMSGLLLITKDIAAETHNFL